VTHLPVPAPFAMNYTAALRESPFLSTLDLAFRSKAEECNRLGAENLRLKVENETLKRRLRDARHRQELWKERQHSWRQREAELLGAIG
jgi:hypothetical protein